MALVRQGTRRAGRRIKPEKLPDPEKQGGYPFFFAQLKAEFGNCGPIIAEHYFAKDVGREYRADYALTDKKIAVEIDGGIWSKGKHGRGSGIHTDQEKTNYYAILGWRLIRVTPDDLKTGYALACVRACVMGAEPPRRMKKAKRGRK